MPREDKGKRVLFQSFKLFLDMVPSPSSNNAGLLFLYPGEISGGNFFRGISLRVRPVQGVNSLSFILFCLLRHASYVVTLESE